jgi:hypothetical protein
MIVSRASIDALLWLEVLVESWLIVPAQASTVAAHWRGLYLAPFVHLGACHAATRLLETRL